MLDFDGKRKAEIEENKKNYMDMLNHEGEWKDWKGELSKSYRRWLDSKGF